MEVEHPKDAAVARRRPRGAVLLEEDDERVGLLEVVALYARPEHVAFA